MTEEERAELSDNLVHGHQLGFLIDDVIDADGYIDLGKLVDLAHFHENVADSGLEVGVLQGFTFIDDDEDSED